MATKHEESDLDLEANGSVDGMTTQFQTFVDSVWAYTGQGEVPDNGTDSFPVPMSPKQTSESKKRSSKTSAVANGDEEVEDGGPDAKKAKKNHSRKVSRRNRMRKEPENKASVIPIPHSIEQASEPDKMLLQMKDAGKSWPEIRVAWKAITGMEVAGSTLPNRYVRLKANMTTFSEAEDKSLIEAKKEVEAIFEKEKWAMIAEAMHAKGGEKHPAMACQKRFKELEKTLSGVTDKA